MYFAFNNFVFNVSHYVLYGRHHSCQKNVQRISLTLYSHHVLYAYKQSRRPLITSCNKTTPTVNSFMSCDIELDLSYQWISRKFAESVKKKVGRNLPRIGHPVNESVVAGK